MELLCNLAVLTVNYGYLSLRLLQITLRTTGKSLDLWNHKVTRPPGCPPRHGARAGACAGARRIACTYAAQIRWDTGYNAAQVKIAILKWYRGAQTLVYCHSYREDLTESEVDLACLASSQMVTPSQVHSFLVFWKRPAERAMMPHRRLKCTNQNQQTLSNKKKSTPKNRPALRWMHHYRASNQVPDVKLLRDGL